MAKAANKSMARWIVGKLRSAGHEAIFAGGCVRDMLLGVRCHDYDIATDATPGQVAKIFPRVVMVGAKFGVAMVLRGERMCEVATFRNDLSYSDGRRPDGVEFSSPKEDALRRDFTINGMFYDPVAEHVIDYVDGRADLAAGVVRTIGLPAKRFAEDYLRMIRAVRFATRLEFRIDKDTAAAIGCNAGKITAISGERICDELTKMLAGSRAGKALNMLHEFGLMQHILPELFEGDEHWAEVLDRAEAVASKGDTVLTFAAMLMNLSRTKISRIVRRWGQSNEFKKSLVFLSEHRNAWPTAAEMPLCEFKRLLADADWPRLRTLWTVRERLEIDSAVQSRRIARRAGSIDPKKINPTPFVTGEDLKNLGLSEGRSLGQVLRVLWNAQLDENVNSRREAMKLAAEMVAKRVKKGRSVRRRH
jgi:poly(A) polymerase